MACRTQRDMPGSSRTQHLWFLPEIPCPLRRVPEQQRLLFNPSTRIAQDLYSVHPFLRYPTVLSQAPSPAPYAKELPYPCPILPLAPSMAGIHLKHFSPMSLVIFPARKSDPVPARSPLQFPHP